MEILGAPLNWELSVKTNGAAQFRFLDSTAKLQTISGGTNAVNVRDGQYHHIVGVYNATTTNATLYVDGIAEATGTISNWVPATVSSFGFGIVSIPPPNSSFTLDEARLYNVALSSNDVWQLPNTYYDPDGDGLSNLEEYQMGTNPKLADTDGDGLPDGWEITHNLDPLSATGDDGASGDPDGDGFTNAQEYQSGTDPQDSNSHVFALLTIPNSWAVYTNSTTVKVVSDIRSTNQWVTVKAAEFFLDSTNGIVNGNGTAMSAQDGTFNSTNETGVAYFTPSFPAGERHEIFIHAKGLDNLWCPFVKTIINPNVNDILDKIHANYSAIQDLQYNVVITRRDNGVGVSTNSTSVRMKGPYKVRSDDGDGNVSIRNENRYGWYNTTEGVGDSFEEGLNGDFTAESNRSSDYFWDFTIATNRSAFSISNSVNSASFDLLSTPNTNVVWFTEQSVVDYTKGFVSEINMTVEGVSTKSEFLNPTEVFPGKWMFVTHRCTIDFDTGDQIVIESTMTGLQVNQGLSDSLFDIPVQ